MLSHFNCILWFLLAFVGQELGPYWAMLGHFGQRWHHIGLMLGHFALFSDLCRPLPWTWAFQCRWIFVHARRLQKTHKIPGENTICGVRCWLFLLLFLFLSWGMLQLGYVCLISGLCWAIVGYVGTILGSCWAILWFVLAFVGQELGPYSAYLGPFSVMLGHVGPYWHHIGLMLGRFRGIFWFVLAFVGQELGPHWAYLGPFWAMLWHFGLYWHHIGLMLGHLGLFWDMCQPLSWIWAFQCRWIFVHATRLQKIP